MTGILTAGYTAFNVNGVLVTENFYQKCWGAIIRERGFITELMAFLKKLILCW